MLGYKLCPALGPLHSCARLQSLITWDVLGWFASCGIQALFGGQNSQRMLGECLVNNFISPLLCPCLCVHRCQAWLQLCSALRIIQGLRWQSCQHLCRCCY